MRRAARSDRAVWLVMAIALTSSDFASLDAQAPAASIIEIRLSPSHEHYRRRIENAANESLARFSEWLGPIPSEKVVITDRRAVNDSYAIVLDLPWRPAPSTMDVESQVSYGMAQLWWDHRIDDGEDSAVISGVSWYLQGRVVERLYDFAFLNPGHSSEAVRFFGGAVPWQFPLLRMSRWTSGLGRFEYLRGDDRREWPMLARRLPIGVNPDAIRIAHAFASLERSVGWPAVQGALFEWVHRVRLTTLSSAGLFEVIGSALGQDVSKLFEIARDGNRTIDYAVGTLSSASCPTGKCVITRVTTERAGNASVPQEVEARVEFADGQQVDARWDGRAESKEFEFESPVPPAGVHLDPNRIVLLDTNWLNNDRLVTPRTNVPIRKWVARWVVWLQDASLSYASLF